MEGTGEMGALVSRRNFLVASLAAGAIVVTGGFTARLGPAAPGAIVLSVHELEIVDAIAEVLFPAGTLGVGHAEAQVAHKVDRIVAELLDPQRVAGFRYVLRAVEMGTQAARGVRFSPLPLEDRVEVLEAWADPSVLPRKVGFDVIRLFLGMAYFRHPKVLETIGWRAECGGAST